MTSRFGANLTALECRGAAPSEHTAWHADPDPQEANRTHGAPMKCPRCRQDAREGDRFCSACGAPLVVCSNPECGAACSYGDQFCARCGTVLRGVRDSVASYAPERRHLTVLFCDLVGSTALAGRLDPEDMRRVIRGYQEACRRAIKEFDGVVDRYQGDGIMVDFGYPKAHEDDAERAVRAGLKIIDAIHELRHAPGGAGLPPISARIGIATGLVVAGDLIGEGSSREMAIVGETPNIAARVQSAAEPDTVVIADSTRALLKELFEYCDLGARELKGIDHPVRLWQVVRARTTDRFEATHGSRLIPLIGRNEEVERLLRRWERAQSGCGQVALLSGDPGIGKSRLIRALRDRIGDRPYQRLTFQCSAYHTDTALHPVVGHLERAAGFSVGDDNRKKLGKLEALIGRDGPPAEAIVPLLADLLRIPAGDRYPRLDLKPQAVKTRTLAAIRDHLLGLAGRRPTLIGFEDAHWIDPTSLELLDLLVDDAASATLMLVITFRPDFEARWVGQPHVTLLCLSRLERRDCAAIVRAATGGKTLPHALIERIVERTDGVPLYLEELTKTVAASDILEEEAHRYVLKGPLPALAIPPTLQDSLMARIDRVAAGREVAQIGAVIGRTFRYGLLAEVAPVPPSQLERALASLVDAGLVFRRGGPADAEYVFKHALVQKAAYDSLLRTRRKDLHRQIAEALEARSETHADVEPEILARHYIEASQPEPAVRYLARSVHRALARSANLEAIGLVTRGLELLKALPDTDQWAEHTLALQLALGEAYRCTKGFASREAEHCFLEARALCERLNDTPQLIDALRGLYACYYVRGELARAQQQAEEVLEIGRGRAHRPCRMLGHYFLGCVMFWRGQFVDARRELERALELYEPEQRIGGPLSAQLDPGSAILDHLGFTMWMLGYPDQALELSTRSVRTAKGLHQPFTLAMALAWACWTGMCCGRDDLIAPYAAELAAVTTEHGFDYLGACAVFLEARALIRAGEHERGLEHIARAFDRFRSARAGIGLPWAMTLQVDACAELGMTERALRTVDEALEYVEAHDEHHWEAELRRLYGELLLAADPERAGEAEEAFTRARELAERQSARSLELRAAMSLARLLDRRGEGERGRAMLREVYDWFTEGFQTPDLVAARVLLERLQG